MDILQTIVFKVATKYSLITAFVVVGGLTWISYFVSKHLTKGRMHGSAIAIILGLVLAYVGGTMTGGKNGIADIAFFSGMAFMGGSMLRDFCIIATAFGIKLEELKKAGLAGTLALVISTFMSFFIGAAVSYAFGYTDSVSMSTIGAGAVTFIVGPVTGTALGATSEVIALSIAAGVVKSIAVMLLTPFLAKRFGLTTPAAATVYGGLMGTTSGVSAGLAATDAKLVPYGAMVATFYTGFGCLVCPSVCYFILQAIVG
nr:malonate transporter subunit MadM [uncultured Cohaesibacter sp.]